MRVGKTVDLAVVQQTTGCSQRALSKYINGKLSQTENKFE